MKTGPDDLLSIADAAIARGVSRQALYHAVREGRLPVAARRPRSGGKNGAVLVRRADLEALEIRGPLAGRERGRVDRQRKAWAPRMSALGALLTSARLGSGRTLAEVADEAGVTVTALSGYERGQMVKMPLHLAARLARAYGIPLASLARAVLGDDVPDDEPRPNALDGLVLTETEERALLAFLRYLREGPAGPTE